MQQGTANAVPCVLFVIYFVISDFLNYSPYSNFLNPAVQKKIPYLLFVFIALQQRALYIPV